MKTEERNFGENEVTTKLEVLRVDSEKGAFEYVQDEVVLESEFQLDVNNKLFTVFTCSPSKITELTVGHLITQQVIQSPEEIEHLRFEKKKIVVELKHKKDIVIDMKKEANDSQESQRIKIHSETIMNAARTLDIKASVFKRTGGTHAAVMLDNNGEVLAFSEDIGRHNAVDKVVGEAALKRISMWQMILALTGRLSSEIVNKAANASIPVVISLAASTDKGVDVAQKRGLTLIGFVRGRRYNIYSHPERLSYNT